MSKLYPKDDELWSNPRNPEAKYVQKISPKKVRSMRRRGWAVIYDSWDILNDDTGLLGVIGYRLRDPDGAYISPKPRKYASEAWDDILI